MEKVPINLRNNALSEYLQKCGLKLIHRGKVRDTYRLDDHRLLVVVSDRISIFDFVLNVLITKKGEVLTALTHFWLTKIFKNLNHHLVQSDMVDGFNFAYDLHEKFSELPIERCLVVKDLTSTMYPFEMIFRHHIGGSVYNKYKETGMAGGQNLPPNLPKWSKLKMPIFTPSTKEEVGHDINVDADYFFKEMEKKGLREEALEAVGLLAGAYGRAYEYAEERGIVILDTKFEVAGLTFADEILTPDSSRFAYKTDWEQAMKEGRDPYFMDKQPVRDLGSKIETPFYNGDKKVVGINKLDPGNQEHMDFVHGLSWPKEVTEGTTKRYLDLFKAITGQDLESYQVNEMGVKLLKPSNV